MIKHPQNDDIVLFTEAELRCKATKKTVLLAGFADKLAYLRVRFATPMKVNSCCRSLSHNKDIGGHLRSLHIYDSERHGVTGCLAIDIHIPNAQYASDLIGVAHSEGWSLGVAKTFIHLDRRDMVGLPQAAFGY